MSNTFIRHSLLRFESVREQTFSKWPLAVPTGKDLAQAGFYYTGYSTCASCFSCGVSFFNWNFPLTPPMEKHQSIKPDCLFLRGIDFSILSPVENASAEENLGIQTYVPHVAGYRVEPEDNATIFSESTIFDPPQFYARNTLLNGPNLTIPIISYTRIPPAKSNFLLDFEGFLVLMRNEKERLKTFNIARWSHAKPTKEDVAQAGFFHLQLSDYTQCAFCLTVIAVWNNVNPLEFHKSANPQCPFVRGEDVGNTPILQAPNALTCNVCLVQERCIVFFPCKHCSCCASCGLREAIKSCVVCRADIRRKERIIFS